MQALQQQFAGRDDFAIVAISKDTEEYLADLDELVAKEDFEYPVLYLGNDEELQRRLNWYASSIPAQFLVHPDGRILTSLAMNVKLPGMLENLLAMPAAPQPISINTRHEFNNAMDLLVHVTINSPYEQAMPVNVWAGHNVKIYVPEYDTEHTGEKNADTFERLEDGSLGEFTAAPGTSEFDFTVPALADAHAIQYGVFIELPGTALASPDTAMRASSSEFVWIPE